MPPRSTARARRAERVARTLVVCAGDAAADAGSAGRAGRALARNTVTLRWIENDAPPPEVLGAGR
jgi:hypothetical protein